MSTQFKVRVAPVLIVCTFLALALAGLNCGSDSPSGVTQYGEVHLVVGAGGWEEAGVLVQDGGAVPVDDIESFLLRVDQIVLNVSAEDDSAEAKQDSAGKVVVFDASELPAVDNEIDLVDLTNLSDIFSSAEVPPDDYKQIRMEIADPRLNLVGDPVDEYRTNVSLTANGRLFANVDLTISSGETVYLRLVLNDLHLVEKGNGDFVLTPQLRVEIVPEL